MAVWDHRANTGNAAYQLYLYVTETEFIDAGPGPGYGPGVTKLNVEIGYIKVGSSGGYGSSNPSVPFEFHLHGNNNGDISGTGAYNFGANDAIGTRRALYIQAGWTFSHNSNYDGKLTLNTMGKANSSGTSIGSAQVGWGMIPMTTFIRDAAAPATPQLATRDSATQQTIKSFNSPEWGLGSTAILHVLDRAENASFNTNVATEYPTTAGNAAHNVVQSGLTPHKTYYYRSATRGRDNDYIRSGILTVHDRPSKSDSPTVTARTTTQLTLGINSPSYTGEGITERETQLLATNGSTVLQTSTHLTAPVFSSLSRVTNYKSQTRAKNSVGWSDWSDTSSHNTLGTVPSAPSGYSAYDIASTSAKVSLGSISDNGGSVPTQVRVKVSTTASDTGLLGTVTQNSWNPVTLRGLTKDTQYYVAEAAYNSVEGGGWGAYGAWVGFKTLANVPNSPVLSTIATSNTNATLGWTVPSQLNGATIVGYKLRVGSNPALTTEVQELPIAAGVLNQVVTGLQAGKNYWAEVWAETGNGKGSVSNLLAFTTAGGSGSVSGIWLDVAGVAKFCEVWYSGSDGIPRLSEVWYSGSDGVPKLCGG